jgi:enoyl-[acyl-carrier protein] reductase / trans-2-enoyl-CoA reductase (NAD+)
MIIKPKFKGFICTTAHPEGCKKNVLNSIDYLKGQKKIDLGKNVLVIGASAGFGLASRMALTFSGGASTIGVFFERKYTDKKNGSAGWYNTAAFEEAATKEGYYAKSINGDAFSEEVKAKVIDLIKKDGLKIDMVVYSLASPRRTHPITGETFQSTLKPIGSTYAGKTVDMHTGEVTEITIEPAQEEEVQGTVAVMGGEDWKMWILRLMEEGLLAEGATTLAYSYLGPTCTHPIYKEGTIGKAKEHLDRTAKELHEVLSPLGGKAFISVNKALVTQASSAIPVVPLYISLLYKVMKREGIHEGCTEQMYRLFYEMSSNALNLDNQGRIRMDNLEMQENVQEEVSKLWEEVSTQNIYELSDLSGYRSEFFNIFGFEVVGINYEQDVDVNFDIIGLVEESIEE